MHTSEHAFMHGSGTHLVGKHDGTQAHARFVSKVDGPCDIDSSPKNATEKHRHATTHALLDCVEEPAVRDAFNVTLHDRAHAVKRARQDAHDCAADERRVQPCVCV
jgi:hypothetical protein